MQYAAFTELLTLRLRLRKLSQTDAEQFYAFASDPDVCRYMLWKPHNEIADSYASIQASLTRYETEPYYRWGIALKDNDILIGMISLLGFEEASSRCSFAYMLNQDYWNRGLGTEALCAVIRFAFEKMQMEIIEADHFSENPASGHVMRKAGMAYQKTIPAKYEKNGTVYDAHQYILTRSEWEK